MKGTVEVVALEFDVMLKSPMPPIGLVVAVAKLYFFTLSLT